MAKIKVDFGDVDPEIRKSSGKSRHIPEGDYLVKVNSSETLKSERTGGRYIRWTATVTEPAKFRGTTLRGTTSLKPEALWALRNLIHAATGKNVAGKTINFDPSLIYGKTVGATVEDNEYDRNGKTVLSSQIGTFFPSSDYEEADSDEEETDEEEVEEDEEYEDDEVDLDEVDLDEI